MNTRYFIASPSVYAGVCQQLDAAYGYPNAETKTQRALPLAADLPTDAQGRVYLVIAGEYCDYEAAATLLPKLLAVGSVVEITEADYIAAFPLAEPDWHEPRP